MYIVRILFECENIRFRTIKWGLTPQNPNLYSKKKNARTIHFDRIESRGIHMTVKEFRAISASTVFALIPVDDAVYTDEFNIFHTHTNRPYVFSDDVNAEDREIDFVDAVQDEDLDEPVIYVYTK